MTPISPARIAGLFLLLLLTAASLAFFHLFRAEATDIPSNEPSAAGWVTDGAVYAIKAVPGGRAYIGGDFDLVGPNTGGGGALDLDTGQMLSGSARIAGQVRTAVPDGAGGWFVGGNFTKIGDEPVSNIAHILSDGSLDTVWDVSVNAAVNDLALVGSNLYISGGFTTINSVSRVNLAAVNVVTRSVLGWSPTPSPVGSVQSLAAGADTVYVGGSFSTIGGVAKNGLAAYDSGTGALETWSVTPDGAVRDISVSGDTVFVAGSFLNVSGASRPHAAAVSASSSAVLPWAPNVNADVLDIAPADDRVVLAGWFSSVNGQSRPYLAAVDNVTGDTTEWTPQPDSYVDALLVSGDALFAGGNFRTINGAERRGLVQMDLSSGATPDVAEWERKIIGSISMLSVSGSSIFTGGDAGSIAAEDRSNLAEIAADGSATGWDPGSNGTVRALEVSGDLVYAGGEFTTMSGTPRARLAAISGSSGLLDAWDPGANNIVRALAASDDVIYAGGDFTNIAGQSRNRMAALDISGASTGDALGFNPGADGSVYTILPSGSVIFAGGKFDSIGGQSRSAVAALSPGTGAATAWNANVWQTNPVKEKFVKGIVVIGTTVYVGGSFDWVGGGIRNNAAAVDTMGNLQSWNPNADGPVNAMHARGNTIWMGGEFSTMFGFGGDRLAGVTTAGTRVWTPWNAIDGNVHSVQVTDFGLLAGGSFTGIGSDPAYHLARFEDVTPPNTVLSTVPTFSTWMTATPDITLTRSESGYTQYQWDSSGDGGWLTYPGTFTYEMGEGAHRLYFRSVDLADNTEEIDSRLFQVDTTPPTTPGLTSPSHTTTDVSHDNTIQVDFAPVASDATSGLQNYCVSWTTLPADEPAQCNVDPGVAGVTSDPLADGSWYLHIMAVDVAGNATPTQHIGPFQIDVLSSGQISENPSTENWITDGAVYSVAQGANGKTYIGGIFNWVGPMSGGGVPVSVSSAEPAAVYPKVNGRVLSSAADGNGGWYIGGMFEEVDGKARKRAAHILPDGSLDESWAPDLDEAVYGIAVSGDSVYIGGSFTVVDGVARNYLAELTGASAQVTDWDPSPDSGVEDLLVDDDELLTAGNFLNIGGQHRNYLAALDISGATTGEASAWNPSPDNSVTGIEASGDALFVGGSFDTIGGEPRSRLASVDISGGTTGEATSFNPNVSNASVTAIALSGSSLYVGGGFYAVGGIARDSLAAIDASGATTGDVLSFDPPGPARDIYDLAVIGDTVYVGGSFHQIGGADRDYLAALDTAGNATTWDARVDNYVFSLEPQGDEIYVGGDQRTVGAVARTNLAELDSDGRATAWDPGSNGMVRSLVASSDVIFAGGSFTRAGGHDRSNIAAIDISGSTTGEATTWNPAANGSVYSLAVSGDAVLLGGIFSKVGGAARDRIAAVSMSGTGAATAWNPGSNSTVRDILPASGRIFIAGDFSQAGGAPRTGIAAIDPASGAAMTWDAQANGSVWGMALHNDILYLGGQFSAVRGQTRERLAAVDPSTAAHSDWNPGTTSPWSGPVSSITVGNDTLVASGAFVTAGGEPRNYIASFDLPTGELTGWSPLLGSVPNLVAALGENLFVGGSFQSVNGLPINSLAAFSFMDTEAPTTTLDSPASDGNLGWYKTAPELILTSSEAGATQYVWDSTVDGEWSTYSDSSPVTASPGIHTFYYRSVDLAGNTEDTKSAVYKVDTEMPTNVATLTSSHGTVNWSPDRTVQMNWSGANDTGSGVDGFAYSFTRGASDVPVSAKNAEQGGTTFTSGSLSDGVWYFHIKTRDNATNWSTTRHYGPIRIDGTPPRIGYTAGTYVKGIQFIPVGAWDWDGSGVQAVYLYDNYTLKSFDATNPYAPGINTALISNGTHFFRVRAKDKAGNYSGYGTLTYQVDNYKPRTAAPYSASVKRYSSAKLYFKVSDPYSPTANVKIVVKNSAGRTVKTLYPGWKGTNSLQSIGYAVGLGRGTYRFYIYATDRAGNLQYNVASNKLVVR